VETRPAQGLAPRRPGRFLRVAALATSLTLLALASGGACADGGEPLAARIETLTKLAWDDPKKALDSLLEVRDAIEQGGDVGVRAHWQFAYGSAQDSLGNLSVAEHAYRDAISLAEQAEDTKQEADAAYALALLLNQTERYPEAAEVASKYLLVARQAGDLRNASMLQQQLGRMFAGLGDEENALGQMKEALKTAEASGSEETLSFAEYNLGIASSEAGQYELAERFLQKSLEYDRAHNAPAQNIIIDLVRLGQAIGGRGDVDGAQRRLEEAIALAHPSGFAYEEALATTALSRLLLQGSRFADAVSASERALDLLSSGLMGNTGSTRADALAAHARALAATGDHRAAAEEFEEAMRVYEGKGKLDEVAESRSGLADAQAAMGDVRAAFESSRRAVIETKQANEQSRKRSRDALRIAYSVEREAAENERLKSQIASQEAKLEEQVRRARWQRVAVSSLAVLLAVTLLVYFWQRRMRRELMSLATTDALTNVANRRAILAYGSEQMGESLEHNLPLSIVAMDIDHFKTINDRFGHDAGDRVLLKVSSLLRAGIRKRDMIGRLGGEEFLIILPGYDAEDAAAIADRLRDTLSKTDMSDVAPGLRVTSSFGVASLVDCNDDFSELLRHADRRLYRAKDVGRNKVVYLPKFDRTQVFVGKAL
jgi:diguanylate cyclase (GGDEF)-like protein